MKNIIPRIFITTAIGLSLSSCMEFGPQTKTHEICQNIAIKRLKHPDSYDFTSMEEKKANQITSTKISFMAWNDYKVPIPHNIECHFSVSEGNQPKVLTSIKWNGRLIRQHELDELNVEFLQNKKPDVN